jgi:hypothetical protein
MENSKMFVVTHKDKNISNLPIGYDYICVNPKINGFSYYDNVGNNISSKNGSYCELTAIYWIWKNTSYDNFGISHYRRFFVKSSKEGLHILDVKELEDKLRGHDIIMPAKINLGISTKDQYDFTANFEDLRLCLDYIKRKDPSYSPIIKSFLRCHEMFYSNMFYGKRKILDNYFDWLFDVLKYAESKIDISRYSKGQKRVFGFIAERLINIWLVHENINVIEVPIVETLDGTNRLAMDHTIHINKLSLIFKRTYHFIKRKLITRRY